MGRFLNILNSRILKLNTYILLVGMSDLLQFNMNDTWVFEFLDRLRILTFFVALHIQSNLPMRSPLLNSHLY